MLRAYLFFFLSFPLLAQPGSPDIKVIPNPRSPEDFEHQFKGCPENSECDQIMGHQLQNWNNLIKKLKNEQMTGQKKAQFLELFRSKYGIPSEFYTFQKSQLGFKPLIFNSHCKEHNPKQEDQKVLRGISFLKSMGKDKALAWRDQTQIEVPTGEILIPQPVVVYFEKGEKTYFLPLGDQPLFIKDQNLYIMKEEDGFFYVLKVGPEGEWKIEDIDFTKLSQWEDHRENMSCPTEKAKKAPAMFGVEFCKSVWDENSKKPVLVKMHQGCPT
jgi:hypothetical protein